MLFSQYEFIFLFLPAVLFVFYSTENVGFRLRVLTVASLIFYACWDWKLLFLLLASQAVNFAAGRLIARTRSRALLLATAFLNLLPLGYYKYSSFFASVFFHTHQFDLASLIIPLGISFYTFTQLAYLIDCWKDGKAETDPWRYLFFVTFFPHLIAGPIIHYRDLIPQLDQPRLNPRFFFSGVLYFFIGLIKKTVLADQLAQICNPVFAAGTAPSTESAVVAVLAYTLQLYFDFSGYSDMAVGLGRFFGIDFPKNFESPYQARGISDFWRRWHITLSNFLRDYIYIPLGGNRRGSARTYANLFLTMVIGGLWHGAGWTFLLWGALHGLWLALESAYKRHFRFVPPPILANLLTFVILALLWVLFRARNVDQAISIYASLGKGGAWQWNADYWLLVIGLILIYLPNSHRIVRWFESLHASAIESFVFGLRRRLLFYCLAWHVLLVTLAWGFYFKEWDRSLYRRLPITRSSQELVHDWGDFRQSFWTHLIHIRPEKKKVLITGSSYSTFLGSYSFTVDGEPHISMPLGLVGASVLNGVRTAFCALSVKNVSVIAVGVSPFGVHAGLRPTFDGQSSEMLRYDKSSLVKIRLDGMQSAGPWAGFAALKPSFQWMEFLAPGLSDARFFEFRDFLSVLMFPWADCRGDDERRKNGTISELPMDAEARTNADANFSKKASEALANLSPPTDVLSSVFISPYQAREALEEISSSGGYYQLFKVLARKCEKKKIRLIIYNPPIAPETSAYFPEGYVAAYRIALQKMCQELNIELIDQSRLYPWSAKFFQDGVHLHREYRVLQHKQLLYEIFK